jgi:hypothetical protein
VRGARSCPKSGFPAAPRGKQGAPGELIRMSEAARPHAQFLRRMGLVTFVFDLVAAAVALAAEHGHAHAFGSYWAALFWTTTQLLTVSSQLQNPDSTAAHILDVVMQVLAISIVTSIAGSWAAFFHHRRHGEAAAASAQS